MPRSSSNNRDRNLTALPLVTQVEGVRIYVDGDDGSFWARIGRDVVSRKNLAEMKRLISKRARSVTVLVIGDADTFMSRVPDIATLDIAGVEKTPGGYGQHRYKYRRKDGDLVEAWRFDIYPFDPSVQDLFSTLRREHDDAVAAHKAFIKEWSARWNAERMKLTKLTPEQVKEMRDSVTDTEIAVSGGVPFAEVPDDDD